MTPFDCRLPIIAAEARVKTPHVFMTWHAMRDMGAGFHVEAFAAFAGLEIRHVSAIMAAIEAHAPITAKRATSPRGTRLPNDWTLPDTWAAWAYQARHWTPEEIAQEGEIFACYWQAATGKNAIKLDWEKTWQNHVRRSYRADGVYVKPAGAPLDHAAQIERTAALYERMGRTVEAAELRASLDSNVVPLRREA